MTALLPVLLLLVGAFALWTIMTGLGRGKMVLLTRGLFHRARRETRPARFWTYTLFDAALTAALLWVALLSVTDR